MEGSAVILSQDAFSGKSVRTVLLMCRRSVTADAIGMAKERGRHEGEDVDGAGIGFEHKHGGDTTMYPGSGLSVEITPLLLLISDLSIYWSYNNCSGEGGSGRGQCSLLLP